MCQGSLCSVSKLMSGVIIMSRKIAFTFFIFAFVISYTIAAEDAKSDNKTVASTNDIVTSVSLSDIAKNTTNTSTEAPSTTHTTPKPPITQSAQPTTPIPITTTPPPPTTPAPTTPAPAPTTPAPAPTTPAPVPPPKPTEDIWIVSENNKTCIKMKSKIAIHATYGNKTKQEKVDVSVPSNVNITGSCGSNSSEIQFLKLQWSSDKVKNATNSVKFSFNKQQKDATYYIEKIYIVINVNDTNSTAINLTFAGKEFIGHENYSYSCASPPQLELNGTEGVSGHLALSSFQYEAFGITNEKKFATGQDCASGDTPDIVPILVAGALIVLVGLVLVAYVVQRRRSRERGYLSM
ncbi:lysosome-associated membrane glycoprotein 1 [Lycorma delicatula]|uniref:lysosome-associated membrane glycoprotein 1 n=1 Tax=Lycorma delicatula TaxID=130591 RepID=UPI003F515FA5